MRILRRAGYPTHPRGVESALDGPTNDAHAGRSSALEFPGIRTKGGEKHLKRPIRGSFGAFPTLVTASAGVRPRNSRRPKPRTPRARTGRAGRGADLGHGIGGSSIGEPNGTHQPTGTDQPTRTDQSTGTGHATRTDQPTRPATTGLPRQRREEGPGMSVPAPVLSTAATDGAPTCSERTAPPGPPHHTVHPRAPSRSRTKPPARSALRAPAPSHPGAAPPRVEGEHGGMPEHAIEHLARDRGGQRPGSTTTKGTEDIPESHSATAGPVTG